MKNSKKALLFVYFVNAVNPKTNEIDLPEFLKAHNLTIAELYEYVFQGRALAQTIYQDLDKFASKNSFANYYNYLPSECKVFISTMEKINLDLI